MIKNKTMMKNLLIGLIAILFLFGGVSRGQEWEQLTTGLESEDDPWILYDMHFPPGQNDVGYAVASLYTVGQEGKIIKTVDGGDTWDVIWPETGTIKGMTVVWFLSADVGFAGGYQQSGGTSYFIKTTDGGATWTEIDFGDVWYFETIEFWDENNGILGSRGTEAWVTDDAGATWTEATGITTGIFDISYATADILYLVGGDEIMCKSEDGGLTWTEFYSGTFQRYFFGVDFANENFGVVGGEDGKILSTTDGGDSWSEYATGYHNFYPVVAFPADSAYVGGTDADIYKTTDAGANWEQDMNGDGSSSLYRIQFTDNRTGYTCGAWGRMWRKEAPLSAGFTASETTVCTGSTVDFTDMSTGTVTSWDWTFEGGTPATSTEQNPTVTYNSPGTFDVELTVTDASSSSETTLVVDYMTVLETPGQANTPSGDEAICTDGNFNYSIPAVDYAEAYEWELSPAEAGTCTWNDNEATVETTEDWTGDFTLKVRATNMCGDGEWSDDFSGTIYLTPEVFMLEGGGGFCANGDGVEITLSGSQTDIDYELFLEGEATGNIVSGTGSEISFGLITEVGYYSAEGYNDNCTAIMQEQVEVFNYFPPIEPGTPTGPDAVCNNETSEYESTGSDDADSYEWILMPEEAGTLTADDLTATVVWSTDFDGEAYISLYGINECGDGYPSQELVVDVEAVPTPEISGLDMVCDEDITDYTAEDNEGSTYTWEVTGGTISDGQGTYMITVEWGVPGSGTVTVTEETTAGCEGSSEVFEVFIDNCTDISETGADDDVAVYPNPAKSMLNIEFNNETGAEYQVMIYNHLGQIVYQSEKVSTTGKQKLELNIAHLTEGLYFVKISSGEKVVITKQIIKQ